MGIRRSSRRGIRVCADRRRVGLAGHPDSRSSRYTWWRYAEPAAGIIWSSRMCSARHARPALLVPRGVRAARGRRATAPARPVNNEGEQDQSASDIPNGSGADGGSKHSAAGNVGAAGQTSGSPRQRSTVPPDDRLTTILPPVRDDTPHQLRDPIEAVKAALDGRPAARASERGDPLEMATAALEGRTPRRHQQPSGGPPRRPPAGSAAPEATAARLGLGPADRLDLAAPHQLDVGPSRALRRRRGDAAAADRHVRDGLLHRRHSQAR